MLGEYYFQIWPGLITPSRLDGTDSPRTADPFIQIGFLKDRIYFVNDAETRRLLSPRASCIIIGPRLRPAPRLAGFLKIRLVA